MATHLICVYPFGKYEKGQRVESADEIDVLSADRDHHFVRINVPDEPVLEEPAPVPAMALSYDDK